MLAVIPCGFGVLRYFVKRNIGNSCDFGSRDPGTVLLRLSYTMYLFGRNVKLLSRFLLITIFEYFVHCLLDLNPVLQVYVLGRVFFLHFPDLNCVLMEENISRKI